MVKKAKKRTAKKATPAKRQRVLPKVMSKLIAIALADMKKAEAMREKYIIDLDTWHVPVDVTCKAVSPLTGAAIFDEPVNQHKACVLCAAGSVMEFSLGASKDKVIRELDPFKFPKNERQLNAINDLRGGSVASAAHELGLCCARWDYPSGKEKDWSVFEHFNCEIPEYNRANPKPFHAVMTKLQKKLERAGY